MRFDEDFDFLAFAAQLVADANDALAGPLADDERATVFGWLRLVEDLLALKRELAGAQGRLTQHK